MLSKKIWQAENLFPRIFLFKRGKNIADKVLISKSDHIIVIERNEEYCRILAIKTAKKFEILSLFLQKVLKSMILYVII